MTVGEWIDFLEGFDPELEVDVFFNERDASLYLDSSLEGGSPTSATQSAADPIFITVTH